MNIGELAKRTGMATSKIRFYEAAGLLGVVERKENGFRTYSEHSLVTLAFIQDAQKAGLDLEAIRALLPQHTAIPKAERALKTLLRQLNKACCERGKPYLRSPPKHHGVGSDCR
jgi:DNA-binding transcriptional MerR regulator